MVDELRNQDIADIRVLELVPCINEAAELDYRQDGAVVVSIPMKKPRYLVGPIRWIVPFSDKKRVRVDLLGRDVLEMCDQTKKVENVIEQFARMNKLFFREAQVAVLGFMQEMLRRGVLVLVSSDIIGVRN